MSTLTDNEIGRPRKGKLWLTTLARKLRNWLDGFLQDDASSAAEPRAGQSEELASTPDLPAQGQGVWSEPTLAAEDQAGEFPPNLFRGPGPPEHWLALVREGASELLLPIEEPSVPSQTPPEPAMKIEGRQRKEVEVPPEARSARMREGAPELLLPIEEPSVPSQTPPDPAMKIEGRQRKEVEVPPEAGSARMREGAPRVPTEQRTELWQSAQNTAMNDDERRTGEMPPSAPHRRPSMRLSAESTQPPPKSMGPVRSDSGGLPRVRWIQLLKYKVAGKLSDSSKAHRSQSPDEYSGGLSSPVRQLVHEVPSDIRTIRSPNRLESPPPGATRTPDSVTRSPHSVGGSSPPLSNEPGRYSPSNYSATPAQSTSAFSQVEQKPHGISASALDQPEGKNHSPMADDASFSQQTTSLSSEHRFVKDRPGRWPASPQSDMGGEFRKLRPAAWKRGTEEGNRSPIQTRKNPELMTDADAFGQPALLTTLPLTASKSPRSVDATGTTGDPWPELPEDLYSAAAHSEQFLRSWQHVSALDIEQRGGR